MNRYSKHFHWAIDPTNVIEGLSRENYIMENGIFLPERIVVNNRNCSEDESAIKMESTDRGGLV